MSMDVFMYEWGIQQAKYHNFHMRNEPYMPCTNTRGQDEACISKKVANFYESNPHHMLSTNKMAHNIT